jgi:hypothetical protein
MFFDQSFELVAPAAEKVELAWRAEGGDFRRAAMAHVRGDQFAATVGMEDGEYLFTYYVDGRAVPDPRHAQKLLLSGEGVFVPLRLNRYARTLTVRNFGEADREIRLESDVPWLVAASRLTLPAKHKLKVHLRLLPERMSLGENRGVVRVVAEAATSGEAPEVFEVPVAAELSAGGAVPAFSFRPPSLGALVQGRESARLEVEVGTRGRGELHGMLMLAHTSEFADFLLDAENGPSRFTHVFIIESNRLPCRVRGAVAVTLVTDCYLADMRHLRAEVPYRLTFLKKSLPVMNFGAVRRGGTKTMRLEVTRSDGEEVDLEVVLPESAAPYLECHVARPGVCVFRFRAQALAEGALLEGEVMLTDRRSGLRDGIRFSAEVVGATRPGGAAASASTARS